MHSFPASRSGPSPVLVFLAHVALASQAPDQTLRLEGDAEGEEGDTFGFGAFVENPAGESLTFTWDFGDGSSPVEGREFSSFSHRYVDDDRHTVVARARGSGGLKATDRTTVTVENADPEITHLPPDARQVAGAPVRLWAEARDPGDDRLTYAWAFGDGSEAVRGQDLREVTHTYARPDSYLAALYLDRSPRLTFDYYLLKVGRWSDGVPNEELQQVRPTARKGAVYATQNLPVVATNDNEHEPAHIGEPAMLRWERDGLVVYDDHFTILGSSIRADMYLMQKFYDEVALSTDADLLVAFMPDEIQNFVEYSYVDAGLDDPRTVALFVPQGSRPAPEVVESVPHEFVHAFGLNHLTVCNQDAGGLMGKENKAEIIQRCVDEGVSDPVEGFRLAPGGRSGANKSAPRGTSRRA